LKIKNRYIILFFIVILFLLYLYSCNYLSAKKVIREKRFLFDSFFEISIVSSEESKAKKDLNDLFEQIKKIGEKLDWRDEKSFLFSESKYEVLKVPEELKEFFKQVNFYYNFTEGYFNPFLRKLIIAYNNFVEGTIPPEELQIQKILNQTKKSLFIIDENDNLYIRFPENLDLGAALAGYLVDYSYQILKEKGYNSFLINGSGEIRVSGDKLGKIWLIGIQSPFSNSIIDVVSLPDGYSISTTGSYERYFLYNNEKYHHILNPFSGKPDSKLESVSIITKDSCLSADILSTAVFAMGIDRSIKFCQEKGIEYYIVYKEKNNTIIKKSPFFNK